MGRHCTSPQKLNCEQRNSDTKNHDALVGLLKSSWHIGPQSCHFSVCSLLGSSAPQWPPSKSSFLLYNQSQFLLLVPKEAWEIPWGMLRSLNTFVQSSLWASVYTSILREHILQGSDQMLTSSSMQPSLIHVLEVNMLVFPLYCTSKKLTSLQRSLWVWSIKRPFRVSSNDQSQSSLFSSSLPGFSLTSCSSLLT